MSNSFIGQYLLEKNLLTQQQLDHVLEIQQNSNVRLGQLSINQGMLNIEQVLLINRQQRLLNKKFGDIAIEQQLLTTDQVEQLLALQVSRRKLLGEILLEADFIDSDTLNDVLRAQQRHQQSLYHSIDELSAMQWLGKNVKGILGSSDKLFLRCLNSRFKTTHLIDDINTINQQDNLIGITIADTEHSLCIAMALDGKVMHQIACRFMSIDESECDDALAKDATGEFLNCLAGYVISDVINSDHAPIPSSPFFATESKERLEQYHNPVAIAFTADVGSGAIVIAQR